MRCEKCEKDMFMLKRYAKKHQVFEDVYRCSVCGRNYVETVTFDKMGKRILDGFWVGKNEENT